MILFKEYKASICIHICSMNEWVKMNTWSIKTSTQKRRVHTASSAYITQTEWRGMFCVAGVITTATIAILHRICRVKYVNWELGDRVWWTLLSYSESLVTELCKHFCFMWSNRVKLREHSWLIKIFYQSLGAAMFGLAVWTDLAVLYWIVSRFLARLFSRMYRS